MRQLYAFFIPALILGLVGASGGQVRVAPPTVAPLVRPREAIAIFGGTVQVPLTDFQVSLKSFRDGRGGGLQLLDKLVLVFKMGPQTATLAKEMHDRLTLGPVKILLPQGSRMVELKTAATQVLDARYFLDQSGKDTGGLYAEVTLSASAYGMFVDGVDVGG